MRSLGIMAAAAFAAGCAGFGGDVITQIERSSAYSNERARAATGGVQPVEVVGAPPDGAGPEAVAAALRAPGIYPATTYRAVPPGGGGLRTALVFGATLSPQAVCAAPQPGGAPALVVSAALCQGETPLSGARMRANDLTGPSDPGFDDAMARLMIAILPRERQRLKRED